MGDDGRGGDENLTYLAWDDERDGLDGLRGGDFVRACDFAFRGVDRAPRNEAHPALRIARFVLVQRVKVIALVFIVPDISVALASYDHESRVAREQTLQERERERERERGCDALLTEEKYIVIAPERHHNARRLVQRDRLEVLERADLPHADLPHADLSIAHPAKTRRRDAVVLAHPNHTRPLDARMSLAHPDGLATGARIEQADLAIARGGREELARRVERDALDGIRVSREHCTGALGRAQVPQLDGVVADRAREDVLRRGVPEHLADLARRRVDAQHGRIVDGHPALRVPTVERGAVHLPDEHVAVFPARGDDVVRVGRPVRVEHGRGVAPRERDDVRQFVGYTRSAGEGGRGGEDGERAAARGVPVDADVFLCRWG